MIDCHFHLWTEDNSTPEKRAERAEQIARQAEVTNVDRICLIHERGDDVAECRAYNETVAKYVDEYPDLFYGWARANPKWGEEGVAEFRRAVREDGLIGLKLYAQVKLDDERVAPFAEAAVDMGVPIISHVGELNEHAKPNESDSKNVVGLAERFPDLKLISGHIGGGGFWESRIKRIAPYDNVHLDTSGSVTDAGMLEMAADHLGTDRLVFGTDTWVLPGVGKLEGANLTAEQKARVAYNMESLIPDSTPTKLPDTEVDRRRDAAVEHFERVQEPRTERIVDANAFVGSWPFRDVDGDPDELTALMDRKGVDRAAVSAAESVFYRNPHAGNRQLAERIRGYEDRFIPIATIDPTYPAWETDLHECVEELGMRGVKLLPLHHDYDLDDPAVEEVLDACAALDVPVFFVATLEDQRQRHQHVRIRDHDSLGSNKHFSTDQVNALIDLLKACPETDVVVANAWSSADRILQETTTVSPRGVRLANKTRSGETLFVADDLYMFFRYQGEAIAENIGPDHLVCGPQLPYKVFEAHYCNTDHLPLSEAEKDRIRSENLLSLLGEERPTADPATK